jgi:deoxyribose-phosphate aldolase
MNRTWTKGEIAALIDHTNLKPTATPENIRELCAEAVRNGFASVCVHSCYASLASKELSGTKIGVCVVVGFPLGAMATEIKAEEAKFAVKKGATEIDMVINIGALKAGDRGAVESDIKAVVKAAKPALVKVILECCYLSDQEKALACECAERAGAAFVKTSTGFGTEGATVNDVRLLKEAVAGRLKVKAAGGIHSYRDAVAMAEAGADRIGCSSSVSVIADLPDSVPHQAGTREEP